MLAVGSDCSAAAVTRFTVKRSPLASRLETGLLATTADLASPAAGTLSRARILVAAAPATSRHTRATRVIDFVTQISVSPAGTPHFAENWELIKAEPRQPCELPSNPWMIRVEKPMNSGRCGTQIIGGLDIGYDIGSIPDSCRLQRMQADGPIAASGRPRHADDVELDLAAHRVALQRVADPDPDLVERCSRLVQ